MCKNRRQIAVCFCIFVVTPAQRIFINVFPYFKIVLSAANNMVIIRSLPYVLADLSINKAFKHRNESRNICACRGRRPRRPVCAAVNRNDHVNMVWHYHIFFNGNMRIGVVDGMNHIFNYFSVFRKAYLWAVGDAGPYAAEQHFAVFCTDGEKIGPVLAVIIIFQAGAFSPGIFFHRFPRKKSRSRAAQSSARTPPNTAGLCP